MQGEDGVYSGRETESERNAAGYINTLPRCKVHDH